MNEKHAVVSIAGKTRVLTWGEDPVFPGWKAMSFSTLKDFEALHNKYRRQLPEGRQAGGRAARDMVDPQPSQRANTTAACGSCRPGTRKSSATSGTYGRGSTSRRGRSLTRSMDHTIRT